MVSETVYRMFYLRSNENNSRGTFTLIESEKFLLIFADTEYEKQVEFPMNVLGSDYVFAISQCK